MKKFFGSDKKGSKQSPAPSENPYAQEANDDPYANVAPSPMQSRPGGLPSGPRAGRGGVGLPGGPAPPRQNSVSIMGSAPPPPYQTQAPSPQMDHQQQSPHQPQQQQGYGYGSDRYGAQAGYGGNRYGDGAAYPNEKGGYAPAGPRPGGGGSARGPGGYGGMGRSDSGNDTEGSREALFGGGRDRLAARNAQQPANGAGGVMSPSQSNGPTPNRYGGYGEERELSEQEQIKMEEREIARQIDEERNRTVDTGYRILGVLNSTIETASGTMQNLAQQDERLRNTERNLDLAAIHNRTAEDRTKELKYYNRSLWVPGNPFMSKTRAAEREAKELSQHQQDRIEAEAARRDAAESRGKYDRGMRDIEREMGRTTVGLTPAEMAANNNKFVFDESDDEDDSGPNRELRADRRAKEEEINNVLLPQMQAGVRTLNSMARAFEPRIQESNQLIDRIGTKSDSVDDKVRINRAKLDAIARK